MFSVNLDDLIGIPFVDGGRDLSGADCWGVVMLTFAKYGISIPDFSISCFDSLKINQKIDEQRKHWKRLEKPEVPCLIVFRTDSKNPRVCCHCGVFIRSDYFLHTFKKRNACIEPINHILWKNKIEGFYKYVGDSNS